jgi:hypothetical protein
VSWTTIMSSPACRPQHGLAEQPAMLSTGTPRADGAHQATPPPGKAVTQDRQIACLPRLAPPFAPPFAPRTGRSGVTP